MGHKNRGTRETKLTAGPECLLATPMPASKAEHEQPRQRQCNNLGLLTAARNSTDDMFNVSSSENLKKRHGDFFNDQDELPRSSVTAVSSWITTRRPAAFK